MQLWPLSFWPLLSTVHLRAQTSKAFCSGWRHCRVRSWLDSGGSLKYLGMGDWGPFTCHFCPRNPNQQELEGPMGLPCQEQGRSEGPPYPHCINEETEAGAVQKHARMLRPRLVQPFLRAPSPLSVFLLCPQRRSASIGCLCSRRHSARPCWRSWNTSNSQTCPREGPTP